MLQSAVSLVTNVPKYGKQSIQVMPQGTKYLSHAPKVGTYGKQSIQVMPQGTKYLSNARKVGTDDKLSTSVITQCFLPYTSLGEIWLAEMSKILSTLFHRYFLLHNGFIIFDIPDKSNQYWQHFWSPTRKPQEKTALPQFAGCKISLSCHLRIFLNVPTLTQTQTVAHGCVRGWLYSLFLSPPPTRILFKKS